MNASATPIIRLLLAIWCLAAVSAAAQEVKPQKEDIIPESPRAWRIRQASLPTPALLTGAAEFEVPLFTIESRGLTIPFSLKYRSNGIKVDDDPYPCGYGWSLLPALRVQRKINGRPDEHFPNWLGQPTKSPYELAYKCMADSGAQHLGSICPDRRFDPEHDVFTVIMPDRTLTLLYDNGTFKGVGCGEYRVEGSPGLENIYVIDPRGYVWDFISQGECYNDELFRTEWLLQTVTAPSGDIAVSFEWTLNSQHMAPSFMPVNKEVYYSVANKAEQYNGSNTRGYQDTPGHTGMCELTGIYTDEQSVSLTYTKDSSGFIQMLSKIKVSAKDGTGPSITMSYLSGSGRLLEKVVHSTDGTYTFEYDPQALGTFPGESRYANPSEDWWGFYNARPCLSSYTWLSPSMDIMLPYKQGSGPFSTGSPNPTISSSGWDLRKVRIEGADRRVDTEAMQAKILKKAVLPTGAVVEWEYEPHRFPEITSKYDCYGTFDDTSLSEGGGLRVKKISLSDPSRTSEPEVREYVYGKNGDGMAVCCEAPLLSTFVDRKFHVGYFNNEDIGGVHFVEETGVYEISNQSHYMAGRAGELPIWYSEVSEISAEGKTVSHFGYVCGDNKVRYDTRTPVPVTNHTSFSGGPQLLMSVAYRSTSSGYEKCRTDSMVYESVNADQFHELRILRNKYQTQEVKFVPDFGSDSPFFFQGGAYLTTLRTAITPNCRFSLYTHLDDVYELHSYQLFMTGERLRRRSTTLHTTEGDLTVSEAYEYEEGTSLVCRTAYSTSDGKPHSLEISYVPDDDTGRKMREFNITGVPTKSVRSYGKARTVAQLDMYHNGEHMMLPASFTLIRGGSSVTTTKYRHDMYGNLIESAKADGSVTSYIWGHDGIYPFWRLGGLPVSGLENMYGNKVLRAEGESIDPCRLRSPAVTVTGAEWNRGVGIAALTGYNGVRTVFGYDSELRPSSTAIDGLGTVSTTAYLIGLRGRTYTDERIWHDVSGTLQSRKVTNYDSRGRPSVAVTESSDGKRYATLTAYDNMNRVSQEWAPAPVASVHPDAMDVRASATSFHDDAFPYKSIAYETSQLATPVSVTREGKAWHEGGHAATAVVTTNLGKSTRHNDNVCPRYEIAADGVEYKGLYAAGKLKIEETVDEDGVTLQTFTDMRGLKVMERRGPKGKRLSTRYVYDDYGQLRYILPPCIPNASMSRADEDMHRYAFWYEYDFMGNVTLERIPGCDPVLHRRDPAGREVAVQDGNTAPGWVVHLYDAVGREVVTAYTEWTDTQLRDFLAKPRSVSLSAPASSGNSLKGYSIPGYAMPGVKEVILAKYYDSLGRLVKEDAGGIVSEYGYDNLGRVTTRTDVYPSHTVKRSFKYSYTGKVLECRTEYSGPGSPGVTTLSNTYDGGDRLSASSMVLRGAGGSQSEASILMSYDAVGRMCALKSGDRLSRTIRYDVHGWVDSITTSRSRTAAAARTDTVSFPFRSAIASGAATPVTETETVGYASGRYPRYNGGVSARSFAGGRYDYEYDEHDRLVRALFNPDDDSGANYTCSYGYDKHSNITALSRNGLVNIVGGERKYDLHDYYYYSYDGNRLKSLGSGAAGADYEGRTGLGVGCNGDISYDTNGNVTADGTRGIVSISYNPLNLPERIELESGETILNAYDGRGTKYSSRLLDAAGREVTCRLYVGDAVIDDGSTSMLRFSGGYFDGSGTPNYYITDWQGSVTGVVGHDGTLVQSTGYYPDGEPWVEPKGISRYLFGGKERVGLGGLNMYDFGPRMYNSAAGVWLQPDPAAASYPYLSPYSYCGGNPIRYVDPSGNFIESGWDVFNVALGISSFVSNFNSGNYLDAAVDLVSTSVDAVAAAVPFIPGGASSAVRVARVSGKAIETAKNADKYAPLLKEAQDAFVEIAERVSKAHPEKSSHVRGSKMHKEFSDEVKKLKIDGLNIESEKNVVVNTGIGKNAKKNVRADIVIRDESDHVLAVFDLKTGNAGMSKKQLDKYRKIEINNDYPIYIIFAP